MHDSDSRRSRERLYVRTATVTRGAGIQPKDTSAWFFKLMSNELRETKTISEKNSGRNGGKFHHFRRIRNESALKSRFCQPGRERPRWIGRKPGCARPKGPEPKRSRKRRPI